MSLTFNLNSSSQRALDTAILGCVRDAVQFLSDKHGFDCEEALSEMNIVKSAPAKKPAKQNVLKASIPLPFCGTLLDSCCGIRVNHGLYSQCSNAKDICELSGKTVDYCKTCNKQATANESGAPNAGDIRSRLSGEWTPSKGKLVNFGNVMEKLKISREKADEEAAKLGLTIDESQFLVVKGRRGRPKSDAATSSSDDDTPKKTRGRPKKTKKVINSTAGDDLISALVAQAAAESTESSSSSDADDTASSAKTAKLAEKEAAKTAKLAEKEAAKAAKLAEKEAKLAAKAAEKEAKLAAKAAEKEAAKAAKLAEKEAAKAAKLAEKETKKKPLEETTSAHRRLGVVTAHVSAASKSIEDADSSPMFLADLGTPSSPKCEIRDIGLKSNAEELTDVENKALEEEALGSESDGELEEEESDGSDEEETSIDATIKEIKGKNYVMARDTKHLYDIESHEPLNKYYDEEADEIKNLSDDDDDDDDDE